VAVEHGALLFRTLFISDVHLGARGCQADRLLDFLRYHDADTIYLVGDIVDGWQLRSGWYWPQHHNDVVQKLLRKARKGARIIYCPAITTNSCAIITAPISAASRWWRRRSMRPPTAAAIWSCTATCSTRGQARALARASWRHRLRLRHPDEPLFQRDPPPPRLSYWSLSQWAKHKVKNAVNYIGAFEQTLAAEAQRHASTA
jgi:UDP-2,3-diacylglucosamine pyrophosphatase LpxH